MPEHGLPKSVDGYRKGAAWLAGLSAGGVGLGLQLLGTVGEHSVVPPFLLVLGAVVLLGTILQLVFYYFHLLTYENAVEVLGGLERGPAGEGGATTSPREAEPSGAAATEGPENLAATTKGPDGSVDWESSEEHEKKRRKAQAARDLARENVQRTHPYVFWGFGTGAVLLSLALLWHLFAALAGSGGYALLLGSDGIVLRTHSEGGQVWILDGAGSGRPVWIRIEEADEALPAPSLSELLTVPIGVVGPFSPGEGCEPRAALETGLRELLPRLRELPSPHLVILVGSVDPSPLTAERRRVVATNLHLAAARASCLQGLVAEALGPSVRVIPMASPRGGPTPAELRSVEILAVLPGAG